MMGVGRAEQSPLSSIMELKNTCISTELKTFILTKNAEQNDLRLTLTSFVT